MTTQTNGNSVLVQGRLIWTLGQNLFEGKQKTNMQTKQVVIGVDGKPVVEYGFGLAIPKIDPRTNQQTAEFVKIWQALYAEAMTLFPNGQVPPSFAMKYKDGDTAIDEKGIPYAKREGYAGHLVISCTTQIPIKYFIFENGNNVLVNTGIKCGDYVCAQLNIKAHPAVGQSKAGLYVNPSAVQLISSGKEIINTPSGDQIFGQAAPAYAGQVDAPVAPTMPGYGAQPPVAPQYGQNAPAMPAYGQQSQAPQHDPHYGVLPPNHQPQTAPQMPGYPSQPQQNYPQGNVGQQYGQTQPAMPGMPNQYAQPGAQMGQPSFQPGMNGMTATPPAYPSNQGMPPMPGYPQQ